MNTSMILLAAMTVATAIIAGYRRYVARNEDDFLHLEDAAGTVVQRQVKVARTLSWIDHVGIGMTIATALYAVGLLVLYIYTGLQKMV